MIRRSEIPVRLSPAAAACAAILGGLLLAPGGLPEAGGPLWAEDEPAGQAEPEEKDEKEPPKAKEKAPPPRPSAPAARPATTPAAAPRKPAPPPLRFTDEDLERYRKPAPLETAEGEEGEETVSEPAPAAPSVPGPALKRDPTRTQSGGGGTDYRPPKTARAGRTPPPADPLKVFKDREAMEKFRAEQIQTLRARVTDLESRLGYLKAKKEALINPSPLQVGSTRARDPTSQADPYRPTNPFPEKPGSGKAAIAPMFPPIPPAQTEADAEKDKRMKVKDLLADVETEIKAVEEELETAREELVQVELRFGGAADR